MELPFHLMNLKILFHGVCVTGKGVTGQLVFDYLCSVNAKFILRV
jgi:hypothetical protein